MGMIPISPNGIGRAGENRRPSPVTEEGDTDVARDGSSRRPGGPGLEDVHMV
jgi:hypothetical protein